MAASIASIQSVLKKLKIEDFKPEQNKIFDAIWAGRDCVAVLPTGYGKSLPYQVLTPVRRVEKVPSCTDKIIVCCPLVSLMEDQVHRLRTFGELRAVFKGESAESDSYIKQGAFDILFASPETLVGDKTWRSIIQQFDVSLLVVDEFHTITEWGEDDKSKAAFRKWFSYIGELRALFPRASLLALSATCTRKDYKRVVKILQVKADALFIRVSPNKSNIKLSVKKVKSMEDAFYPVIESLHTMTVSRLLIYCSSIKEVSDVYNFITNEYAEGDIITEMYHSETTESKKSKVRDILRDPAPNCLIVATSALGMGLDVVNCTSVILFGIPKSIVDLLQQVGRVGRDGSKAIAMLLYKSAHLRTAPECVKLVYTVQSCRRKQALCKLLTKSELEQLSETCNVHTCCDICQLSCQCGNCCSLPLEIIFDECDKNTGDSSDNDSDQTISYELSEHVTDDELVEDFSN